MSSHAPILCVLSSLAASLAAQGYTTDFESFFAVPGAGTPCAGQDGFYVPAVAGSIDGAIHLYPLNPLGIPQNPNGGAIFWAGDSVGGSPARSQRAVTVPNGLIRVEFDVLCNYAGAITPVNNIGSFSLQPSTNAVYVNLLAAWPAGVTFPPTTWDADVIAGSGTPPGTVTTVLPDPAFQGLALNVWHHWGVTFDLVAGVHTEFTITNGVTGITTHYVPTTPLLLPTTAVGAPLPTDFRFFCGGSENVFAIDNFTITYAATSTPTGTGCGGLGLSSTGLPIIGSSNFTLNVSGLSVAPLTLMGFGTSSLPGIPLGGGCSLYTTADVGLFGLNGPTSFTLGVPNSLSLAGATLSAQAVELVIGGPPPGFKTSGGNDIVVGL